MQDQQQRVIAGPRREQCRAHRVVAEVESMRGARQSRASSVVGVLSITFAALVGARRRHHVLLRPRNAHDQPRAQRLMPARTSSSAAAQAPRVQRTRQPHRDRDVIRGARAFQFLHEPEACLRK